MPVTSSARLEGSAVGTGSVAEAAKIQVAHNTCRDAENDDTSRIALKLPMRQLGLTVLRYGSFVQSIENEEDNANTDASL